MKYLVTHSMILGGKKKIRKNNYKYLDTVQCYSMKKKLKLLFKNTIINIDKFSKIIYLRCYHCSYHLLTMLCC